MLRHIFQVFFTGLVLTAPVASAAVSTGPHSPSASMAELSAIVAADGLLVEEIRQTSPSRGHAIVRDGIFTDRRDYTLVDGTWTTSRILRTWTTSESAEDVFYTAVLNSDGTIVSCKRQSFDGQGRLTGDTLIGDISGAGTTAFAIEFDGTISGDTEQCSHTYSYTAAGSLAREDFTGGRWITYSYDADTLRLTSQFEGAGDTVAVRRFHSYDADGQLARTTIDDGNGETIDSLDGVTLRLIECVCRDAETTTIERRYLDWETGTEQLLASRTQQFSDDGSVLQETLSDAKDRAYFTQLNIFDAEGETFHRLDSLGHVDSYDLDASESKPEPAATASADYVESTNSRGQVTDRVFADGATESWRYFANGTLSSHTARDGKTTTYQRDAFGRTIAVDHSGTDGTVYWQETIEYSLAGPVAKVDGLGNTTLVDYDAAGRVNATTLIDNQGAEQQRVEYRYGLQGDLEAVLRFYGQSPTDYSATCFERAEDGKVIAVRIENSYGDILQRTPTCPKGQEVSDLVSTERNEHGQIVLEERFAATGEPLTVKRLEYDACGRPTQEIAEVLIDDEVSRQVTTRWDYTAAGQLAAITEDADGQDPATTRYDYDQYGRITAVTHPNDITLTYRYDPAGRLSERKSSVGDLHEEYLYDAAGNLITINDRINDLSTHREYDALGRVVRERLANGLSIARTYDGIGRVTQTELPDGSWIEYEYDAAHLRTVRRLSPNAAVRYQHSYETYDWNGRLRSCSMLGALGSLSYNWTDDSARPTSIDSPYWSAVLPDSDAAQVHISDAAGNTEHHFHYDASGRITNDLAIAKETVREAHYQYDSLDNRIADDLGNYVVNGHNQLLEDGRGSYTYDRNGNLVTIDRDGHVIELSYDSLNRLTGVARDDSYRVAYAYDAFGRRISEQRWRLNDGSWDDLGLRYLVYDGSNDIGTADIDGTLVQLRVLGKEIHGAEIGASVAMELWNDSEMKTYAPIHNHTGSVVCLVDAETGTAAETYRYDAFGVREIYDANGATTDKSATGNPWQYASKRTDGITQLVNFGLRVYDPVTGRWTAKDPAGRIDGPNRYAYVHNDPVRNIDQYGLWGLTTWVSEAASWVYDTVVDKICDSWNKASHATYHVFHEFVPYEQEAAAIEGSLEDAMGSGLFYMTGYEPMETAIGTIGQGEVSDAIRITFLNGIMTSHDEMIHSTALISDTHGGVNVHYIYRATKGWTWDIAQSTLTKAADFIAPQAYLLADRWKGLIKEMGGTQSGGLIIHYAHSIGAVDSLRAAELLTPAEQKMIRVIALGPATMLHEEYVESATNYVSARDGVCLLDPVGIIKAILYEENNVVFLSSVFDGAPLVDHLFTSDTYREIWESLGAEFVSEYGSVE